MGNQHSVWIQSQQEIVEGGTKAAAKRPRKGKMEERMESTHDCFAVVRVGVADPDGLVDKEDVGMLIPAVLEMLGTFFRIGDPAGTYELLFTSRTEESTKMNVPSSMNNPTDEEHPGPPFVHYFFPSELLSRRIQA
jgi:hypothetical protein